MNFLFFKGVFYQIYKLIVLIPVYVKFKLNPSKYTLDDKFKIINTHSFNTLRNIGVTVDVSGYENLPEGNVLFVANHSNWVDAFILLYIVDRPTAMIIAKEANWDRFPILKGWLNIFNCLHLDRKNNRNALRTMQEATSILKDISSVGIFPEGVVTRSDEIGEFKDGAFRMAIKAQVPIVPVLIRNSKDIYIPGGEARLGKIYSKHVSVEIMPPVYDHINNSQIKSKYISELIRNKMIAQQHEEYLSVSCN